MSEDQAAEEVAEQAAAEPTEEPKEEVSTDDGLRDKYRLIAGEEILENGMARPSTLAFLGMYVLGGLVFGVHILFANGLNPADDASFLLKFTANLIEVTSWVSLPIGLVLSMGFLTWANRMLNISTSGRWVPSPCSVRPSSAHHHCRQPHQRHRRLVWSRGRGV